MATILIVDDDPGITSVLQSLLEDEGHTAQTAVGLEAVPLAQVLAPDLIFLDINMPGVDGIEVARRLRADQRTRAIPIVLMSAMHRLRERAKDALVTALLPKPFDLGDVLECVEHLTGEPPT